LLVSLHEVRKDVRQELPGTVSQQDTGYTSNPIKRSTKNQLIKGGIRMKDLDIIKNDLQYQYTNYREKVSEAYDNCESVSAKVKLWVSTNRKMVLGLAISHLIVLIIGTVVV